MANYGATFTASHAARSASVESIIHKRGMQKNNLLGMSIVALVEAALFVALAIANNNAVIGIMAGVVIAEVVNIIISRNEEE